MEHLLQVAETQHSLLTRDQAFDVGLSKRQINWLLERGKLEVLADSVYRVPGSVPTWRQQLMAAVLAAGPGAVASHLSAAALWGLPGFPEAPVEVTRPRARHHKALLGKVHETTFLPEKHRRVVDGIPVTSPALTMLHLCAALRWPERAARTLDNGLAMKLVSVPDVEMVLAEGGRRGRAGSKLLRSLMAERTGAYVPTESELEDLCLAVLASAGITDVERQVVLGGVERIGRVDLYIRRARLVLECQSRRHHGEWLATAADEKRRAALIAAGFEVLFVTWQHLTQDPDSFLAAVFTVLERAA